MVNGDNTLYNLYTTVVHDGRVLLGRGGGLFVLFTVRTCLVMICHGHLSVCLSLCLWVYLHSL